MSLVRPTGTGLIRPTGTVLIRPANVGLVRTASGIAGGNYPAAVLLDTPVGYWRLDDTSGVNALDSSGNSITGTYVNAPTLGVAPLINSGTSVAFASGSSQRVTFGSPAGFNNGSNRFTIECWLKTTQGGAGNPMLCSQDTGSFNNRVFQLRLSTTGKTEFIVLLDVDNAFTKLGAVTINDGLRHHIVGVWDGTNVLVYVDGAVDGAGTAAAGTLEAGVTGMTIASKAAGNFLNGTLDEVARYTTALSAARIAAHFTAGTS